MEDVISIADIKFDFVPTETAKSNRTALLKALYTLYTSQPELNRKENRKRYRFYMGRTHPDLVKKTNFDPIKYSSFKEEFKKAKLPKEEKFLSYIPEKRFWFFFSHCDIDGLEKVISEARDASWRGFNVAQLIMGKVVWKTPVDNK